MDFKNRPRHKHRLALALLVIILGGGILMYARPLPALYPVSNVQASVQPSSVSLAWPATGEAAIGAMGEGVLATHGAQTMRPTASTAKLITALTVMSKYPLSLGQTGPTITLGQADVELYNKYVAENGSVAKVAAGEQISEYQVLEGMLLPSANNLADSLATWAYGSLLAYRVAATKLISSLGLSNTKVGTDASGFLPGTESSAHDLVLLGQAALQNPVLAQIVNQTQATLPIAGNVKNVNWLLGEDGIVGIKTGNSSQAGGVYIFASSYAIDTSHKVTIIGTTQGSPTLQVAMDAAVPLLNSAKNNFKLSSVVQSGKMVAYYKVPWGSTVSALAVRSVSEIVWGSQPPKPILALNTIYAPQPAGAAVGSLSSTSISNNSTVVLQHSIPTPPWWWRIIRHKL